jgi:hypothetical protein
MTNWTCYDCGSYEVFESKLVRINRLACIIDDSCKHGLREILLQKRVTTNFS